MSVTTEEAAETKAMRRSAKSLSAYLNDHLADETLGLELATRASLEHKGTRLGNFLELLSWELEEDRESLVLLMERLGVRREHLGVTPARIAEKVGHLRLTRRSPSLLKLESLDLGINGKLAMWNALRSSVGNHVDGIDFDELIRRAERQAEALERRRAVAADALSYREGSAGARPRAEADRRTTRGFHGRDERRKTRLSFSADPAPQ